MVPGPSYCLKGSIHRVGRQQYNTSSSLPRPSPSFPRRRESTARGTPHAPHRHVIADLIRNPEGRTGRTGPSYWLQGSIHSAGHTNKPTQPPESPSPLMGEESKVRVTARQHQPPSPLSYRLQGSIHRWGTPSVIPAISTVIADLIRNPEVKGGAYQQDNTNRQNPPLP